MEEIKIGSNLTAAAGEAGRRKKVFQIGQHSLTGAQVKSKARRKALATMTSACSRMWGTELETAPESVR
jgi:hypothetical protein